MNVGKLAEDFLSNPPHFPRHNHYTPPPPRHHHPAFPLNQHPLATSPGSRPGLTKRYFHWQ